MLPLKLNQKHWEEGKREVQFGVQFFLSLANEVYAFTTHYLHIYKLERKM